MENYTDKIPSTCKIPFVYVAQKGFPVWVPRVSYGCRSSLLPFKEVRETAHLFAIKIYRHLLLCFSSTQCGNDQLAGKYYM